MAQPNPTDDVVTVCENPNDVVTVFEIESEDGNFNDVDWLETTLLEEDGNLLSHALPSLPVEQPSSSSNFDTQIEANSSIVS